MRKFYIFVRVIVDIVSKSHCHKIGISDVCVVIVKFPRSITVGSELDMSVETTFILGCSHVGSSDNRNKNITLKLKLVKFYTGVIIVSLTK